MRPLDILILFKISLSAKSEWKVKDLAISLEISQSETSESLNRSAIANLLSDDKRFLMRQSFLDFLEFGLKYVFPQKPGAIVRGIPTAHSAPPLNNIVHSEENYVWPYHLGNVRGQTVEPLYKTVPAVCLKDQRLYEVLALSDALRIGRSREYSIAIQELKRRIA